MLQSALALLVAVVFVLCMQSERAEEGYVLSAVFFDDCDTDKLQHAWNTTKHARRVNWRAAFLGATVAVLLLVGQGAFRGVSKLDDCLTTWLTVWTLISGSLAWRALRVEDSFEPFFKRLVS